MNGICAAPVASDGPTCLNCPLNAVAASWPPDAATSKYGLLTAFGRKAMLRAVVVPPPPVLPPLTKVNVSWIAPRTPERSTPAITTNRPMKNRRIDQSTDPMRARPLAFRFTTGRPKRTMLPPTSAMAGSQVGALRKNAATDPRRTARVNASPGRWSLGTSSSGGRVRIGAARRRRKAKATPTIAIARQAAVIGAMMAAYSTNGILLWIPMYAFCGFPISVATLPTFTAIPSPTRNGTGSSPIARHACTTIGVISRAIASFRTRALRTAAATMRPARSSVWVRARCATRCDTASKNPHASRPATRSIIPRRRTITSTLIALLLPSLVNWPSCKSAGC